MSLPALLAAAAIALAMSPADAPSDELPRDVFAASPGDDVLDVVAFGSSAVVTCGSTSGSTARAIARHGTSR